MEEGKPESKPEVITEQGAQEEVIEPLKDVENTTKALINDIVLKDNFDGSENQKKFFKANDLVPVFLQILSFIITFCFFNTRKIISRSLGVRYL